MEATGRVASPVQGTRRPLARQRGTNLDPGWLVLQAYVADNDWTWPDSQAGATMRRPGPGGELMKMWKPRDAAALDL